jgi:hypothetical protein
MDIQVKMIKELEGGGAICTLDMDEETKEYLIGEGFLAIIKRALLTSESYLKPEMLEKNNEASE